MRELQGEISVRTANTSTTATPAHQPVFALRTLTRAAAEPLVFTVRTPHSSLSWHSRPRPAWPWRNLNPKGPR